MHKLLPPLTVIENELLGFSDTTLQQWIDHDQALPPALVACLNSAPETQWRGDVVRFHSKQKLAEAPAPAQIPDSLKQAINRRQLTQKTAFPAIPTAGQILSICAARSPNGLILQDLPRPLAVVISEPANVADVWHGWVVSGETDYASYWDVLLDSTDEPFDPLVSMIQAWNPVRVYLHYIANILGIISQPRLDAVRAIATEYVNNPSSPTGCTATGRIIQRRVGPFTVQTGQPIIKQNDPREQYQLLYQRAARQYIVEPAQFATQKKTPVSLKMLTQQVSSWANDMVQLIGNRGYSWISLTPEMPEIEDHDEWSPLLHTADKPAELTHTFRYEVGGILRLILNVIDADLLLQIELLSSKSIDIVLMQDTRNIQQTHLTNALIQWEVFLTFNQSYSLIIQHAGKTLHLPLPIFKVRDCTSLPEQNRTMLLHLLGNANPVFFLLQDTSTPAQKRVLNSLNAGSKRIVYADREQVRSVTTLDLHAHLDIELPEHVFVVHETASNQGFVIPVEIKPAPTWQVSDAFGTFGITTAKDPIDGLITLLGQVEKAWEAVYGEILPARWLRALSLRLLCPVHIDLFTGASLQVPLLIMLLRTLGKSPTINTQNAMPFGAGPVFASGVIGKDGNFEDIEKISEKLSGFVRELGSGKIALLTQNQQQILRTSSPTLLQKVQVIEVNSLSDLLHQQSIRIGLENQLCRGYHPSLNENLITLSATFSRKIQFDEARQVSTWAMSQLQDRPYYQFKFACDLAFNLFHRGKFEDAGNYFVQAESLFQSHPQFFGADDFGRLLTIMIDLTIDTQTPQRLLHLQKRINTMDVSVMTGKQRVKVCGALCQFHRFFGPNDKAIEFGRQAVSLADHVYSSSAGRARNYLVHALLVAYKSKKDPAIIAEAQHCLTASQGQWAPQEDTNARNSHLGFCLHLEAEIARLSGQPFTPGPSYWRKTWGHPWLFTLLSCARNLANDEVIRRKCLEELVLQSTKDQQKYGTDSLFGLFNAVYKLFYAVYLQHDQQAVLVQLQAWLDNSLGWKQCLQNLVKSDMDLEGMQILLDAIRYH